MMEQRHFWARSIPPRQDLDGTGWTIKPLIWDSPGFMGSLSIYYSTLAPGVIPHDIHQHPQEEIEVVLSGEIEVVMPEQTTRIGPGSFHYQPAGHPHTIRGSGDEPASFVLIRWQPATPEGAIAPSEGLVYDATTLSPWEQRPGGQEQQLCPPLTLANGTRLVIYARSWTSQDGCVVHTDPFDSLVVLLHGRICGLGHDTRAPAVIYFSAGTPHVVKPVEDGDTTLTLYFEFYPPEPDSGPMERTKVKAWPLR